MSKPSYYRPDIDGLRAVAIIAVLLYHYDISGFSGGFVGVDIFFVISGYLITSIILRELGEDRFSFFKFWERRLRRIVPALFVVLMSTAALSYFIILYPIDFFEFGQTLVTQSFFLANLWFMRTDDYFAAPSETIPLLHTWSLAVEEQFYLIFPVLLFALYRISKKRLSIWLFAFAAAAFSYGLYLALSVPTDRFTIILLPHIWGGATNASAAFYFFIPRAWELLIGSLLAITALTLKNRAAAEIVSFAGIGAVVIGIVSITDTDAFPGLVALWPTVGTAAIIAANTNVKTRTFQFLSFPVFVWIGLISYSLYLWHWPLLVLLKYHASRTLTGSELMLLIGTTFVLAYLTYRFVETPFRIKRIAATTPRMYAYGASALLLMCMVGLMIVHSHGAPKRAPEAAQVIATASTDFNPRRDECFKKSIADIVGDKESCLLGTQDLENISFVLWGDSHADAVMPAFDQYGVETDQTGIFFGVGGCAPLVPSAPITVDQNCELEKQRALAYINERRPAVVYLVSEWENGYALPGETIGVPLGRALIETLALIPAETQVNIMKRIPTYPDTDFRELFKSAATTGVTPHLISDRRFYESFAGSINNQIAQVTRLRPHSSTIDPTDTLCDETQCYFSTTAGTLYRDGSHLTRAAAMEYILPLLLKN